MIGTYAAVLAVCGASLALGQAALALCGARRWSWLAPAVGLALLCAICWGTVRIGGDGVVSALAVLALAAASVVYLRGRLEGGAEALRAGWPVALLALAAASLPFAAEGHFGILGTSFNPDMSQHLLAADRLAHGQGGELLRQGYPLGPHAIVVALNKGLGIGLVQGFSGLTVAVAVLAPLTALAAFAGLKPVPRTAAALVVGLAYVVASYFAQGAFKETIQALLVLAFALALRESTRTWRDLPLRFVPAALIAAGSVYVYSFPGLIWLIGTAAIWLLLELAFSRSGRSGGAGAGGESENGASLPRPQDSPPAAAPPAVGSVLLALLAFAVLVAPEIGRMLDFHSFETFDPNGPGLGNLFGQVSPFEALGIWPSGDFRLAPGDGAVPAVGYYLGAAFALVLLLYGVGRSWRRRESAVLAALAAVLVAYAAARVGGTPYTAAKAIEVGASVVALAILLPLLDGVDWRLCLPGRDKSASAWLRPLLATIFVLAAGVCSLLALANAPVGPTSYSPALVEMRPLVNASSTLVLAPDELLAEQHGVPYISWELRGGRVCIVAASEAGGELLPGVRFVVTRGSAEEPPFPSLRARRVAAPYVLWESTRPVRGKSPCPLIAERQARQGPARCAVVVCSPVGDKRQPRLGAYDGRMEAATEKLSVTLPDGKALELPAGASGADAAAAIGPGLAKAALAIKVDGELRDLAAPLPAGAEIGIVTDRDPEALELIRHDAAHVMAEAVMDLYPGTKVTIGPPIESGFYYDFEFPADTKITEDDLPKIEGAMLKHIGADEEFGRRDVPVAEALEIFSAQDQGYKVELIEDLVRDEGVETVSLYRNGPFEDLCRGPHGPSTGRIKAIKLSSVAGAYWRGDENRERLTRIYGTAFFSKKDLERHLERIEEAKARDHRRLGPQLGIFMLRDEAPGMPFWLPNGTTLLHLIEDEVQDQLRKRGYQEIATPQVLDEQLWHRSGHWDNYRDEMYFMDDGERRFALRPMNCPGACLVYSSDRHSYRELPLRLAEFGRVSRNEREGVLHGLLRVRAFTQDDAHVYCTEDQIADEVASICEAIDELYARFGFDDVKVELSTRPEKAMGSEEQWAKAEAALTEALERQGREYELNPGDGAFYGPKIDFHVTDALGRSWQCGTCQLDFQMPERFDLYFTDNEDQPQRPVMIHRALLGSMERFAGILIEHYGGRFPTWLAPVQAIVLPISDRHNEYAREAMVELREAGVRITIDDRSESIGRKVRDAALRNYPYMLVVGDREQENHGVSVRSQGDGEVGEMAIKDFVTRIETESGHRRRRRNPNANNAKGGKLAK